MNSGSTKRTIYRFGKFEVDFKEGLLRKGGVRVRIQPQPFTILATLLEHPGELVTREDLRQKLWPADTFVDFENGLNAAMTRLRCAIGDSATAPRYITTEARLGYRFVAPVQENSPGDTENTPMPEAPRRPAYVIRPWLYVPAIIVGVGIALAIGRSGYHPQPAVLEQITQDLGLTTDPSVSLDGKLVAYASDRSKEGVLNIWVQQLAPGGKSKQLTFFERDADQPSFSPEGSSIAFRLAQDGGGLYVVPSIGGEPTRIVSYGRDPRYSPDGKWIAFWSSGDSSSRTDPFGTVFVVSAKGGEPKKIPGLNGGYPVWSPDSLHLLIAVISIGLPESHEDWWLTPLDGGTPKQTGAFSMLKKYGVSAEFGKSPRPAYWRNDTVVFSGRQGDSQNIWSIRLPPETGQAKDPVLRLTSGTANETSPSVTASGQIVFASLTENIAIWSLEADRRTAGENLEKVSRSTRHEFTHSVTPDGRYLASALSNGRDQDINWRDLGTGKETVIASPASPLWHPQISRDGSRVAYTDRTADGGIFVKTLSDGSQEKVSASRAYVWDWSPDNSRLLYCKSHLEKEIWAVHFPSKSNTPFLRHNGFQLLQAKYSPDGEWLAFLAVASGRTRLFAVRLQDGLPASGAAWVPLVDENVWTDKPRWSPDGATLYFVSHRDGHRCIWSQKLDPVTKLPIGTPAIVQHFHSTRRSLANVPIYKLEIEIAKNRIFFNQGEVTGNIWSTRPQSAATN